MDEFFWCTGQRSFFEKFGGQFVGEISGDVQAPALLEYLVIQANSYLEYVTIGGGVKLATTVIFGEGVQFNHPSDDPRRGSK